LRSELGLEGRLVFGYAGGFQSWQGVEMLLDAAGRSQRENIAFLIVGGYETKRCGNVLFLPRTTRESLLGLYSICDVLVLPRPRNLVTEVAAPTKFVEYLAMGKPVLTTDVGDASLHVRERRCGVVTQSCDASGITVGIEEFANVPRDELVRMGKRSLSLVCDEFDWGRISGNLTTTLRKLVDSK
jgi:glycosyltransferase involved in cell wall biosynthesis